MDSLPLLNSGLRSTLTELMKKDYFNSDDKVTTADHAHYLLEKHTAILANINGFFLTCNYTTGLYDYVSENIKNCLGYNIKGYTPIEISNLMTYIIDEKHSNFMVGVLFPTVLGYLKEHATSLTGMNYRFTCCAKLKNVYNKYQWYLIDTAIIRVDENGFPLSTLITCTNINQFKKDESVYYNVLKKNCEGVYEIVLEGTEHNKLDECSLTPREIQIINLISQGYLNKQIADKLFITIHTVQSHRKNILKKTKCQGTAELTNFAYTRGLL